MKGSFQSPPAKLKIDLRHAPLQGTVLQTLLRLQQSLEVIKKAGLLARLRIVIS